MSVEKARAFLGLFYVTASKPNLATGWPFVTFWLSLQSQTSSMRPATSVSASKREGAYRLDPLRFSSFDHLQDANEFADKLHVLLV